MSNKNRLQTLGMSTLKARHRQNFIQTYEILHGVDTIDYTKYSP